MTFFMFFSGLGIVFLGAEFFVRCSAGIARRLGISPLVIGLTLVAMGTSAPELAVSLKGTFSGNYDIAVGNVVGSNIFNVLFILGVSSIILPLVVHLQILRIDVPLMIVASVFLWFFSSDLNLSRWEGVALLFLFVSYTVFLIVKSIYESKNGSAAEYDREFGPLPSGIKADRWFCILKPLGILFGLAMLVLGARWMVESAVIMARLWGLSEAVIGLTIVAAGTSLPEVATSITAALKGERDIAVGNVVGSNLFNILGILGLSAFLAPQGLHVAQGILTFDLPIMTAVAFACLPIFFTGKTISRFEGGLFLFYYVAYTIYLIMRTSGHAALPFFNSAMVFFVFPITFLTLILTIRYSQELSKK